MPAREYWKEVISATPNNVCFIAEAYWDREWELQQLQFHYCYDKERFYDRLKHDNAENVRLHLAASLDYQDRLVRFIENHDEPRAAEAFLPEKERAVCWNKGKEHYAVIVNLSECWSQAQVQLPWNDLAGKIWQVVDVLSGEIFERDGYELQLPGLYVDLPAWEFHFLRFQSQSPISMKIRNARQVLIGSFSYPKSITSLPQLLFLFKQALRSVPGWVVLVSLLIVLGGLIVWIYPLVWNLPETGLGPPIKNQGKTLWDWLQLLIIPLVLAIGGYLFNVVLKKREQEATSDNQHQIALQDYINELSRLLLETSLLCQNQEIIHKRLHVHGPRRYYIA